MSDNCRTGAEGEREKRDSDHALRDSDHANSLCALQRSLIFEAEAVTPTETRGKAAGKDRDAIKRVKAQGNLQGKPYGRPGIFEPSSNPLRLMPTVILPRVRCRIEDRVPAAATRKSNRIVLSWFESGFTYVADVGC